jgi:hypothetical protein
MVMRVVRPFQLHGAFKRRIGYAESGLSGLCPRGGMLEWTVRIRAAGHQSYGEQNPGYQSKQAIDFHRS